MKTARKMKSNKRAILTDRLNTLFTEVQRGFSSLFMGIVFWYIATIPKVVKTAVKN
jgi:hypothetical protein